jgi:uncharacterized protein with HEPN domain
MVKADIIILQKIIKEINFLETSTKNMEFQTFLTTEMTRRAAAMTLINIGELTRHLSEEFKNAAQDIPFKEISALRNVTAHRYEEVRFDYVWDTIKRDIPSLKTKIKSYL